MNLRAKLAAWFGRSIVARVVTLSLAMLFAIQIASFSAISASLGQHARSVLPEQLQLGERVLLSLLAQNAQKLTQGATVLAADYGFKQAVLSNDADTIGSALANHGARIGATETALLGTDFSSRATSGREMRELAPVIAQLAMRVVTGNSASEIALLGGKPHQVVLVPLKAPVTVGWVLMGFPLDQRARGQDMKPAVFGTAPDPVDGLGCRLEARHHDTVPRRRARPTVAPARRPARRGRTTAGRLTIALSDGDALRQLRDGKAVESAREVADTLSRCWH